MAIRRRSSSRHVEDLRLTIDCLPVATRVAMLEGVRDAERVIVGAYTDRDGGDIVINPGDRIAQLVFTRVTRPEFVLVDEFAERAGRQAQGFGSTGA